MVFPSIGSGIPKKIDIIRFYVKRSLSKMNQAQAIAVVRDKFNIGEEQRSMKMIIAEVGELYFVLGSHQILMPDTLDKPTSTVMLLEDTFIKIKEKKLTFDEAYYYSQMDMKGDFWLRDLVIFREIFREYGDQVMGE